MGVSEHMARAGRSSVSVRQPAKRRTWRRDRAGKQRVLIRAFDGVLREQGAQGLGVNAVLKRAGVGKNLLYKYFGDLAGLARAWGRGTELLPGEVEITGKDTRAYERMTTAGTDFAQLSRVCRRTASQAAHARDPGQRTAPPQCPHRSARRCSR